MEEGHLTGDACLSFGVRQVVRLADFYGHQDEMPSISSIEASQNSIGAWKVQLFFNSSLAMRTNKEAESTEIHNACLY